MIHRSSGITVTRREVVAFKQQWPCSGLPDAPIYFAFAANGDVVDHMPGLRADSAAINALADDARTGWRAVTHRAEEGV